MREPGGAQTFGEAGRLIPGNRSTEPPTSAGAESPLRGGCGKGLYPLARPGPMSRVGCGRIGLLALMYGPRGVVQAVVPTIPGREQLLAETVASLEEHGIDPVVVPSSPSCGEGWAIGLRACSADYVLLASDDIEVGDVSRLETALARAKAGLVVSPVVVNADGSLQGAGGFGLRLEDGATARTTIFPFALRETFLLVSPWPTSNHHCDAWISECAWRLGRGPIVTHGFELVHKIETPITEGEVRAYESWRARRLDDLGASTPRPDFDAVSRALEGRSIVIMGARARMRTELRLASAGLPTYLATTPGRATGASRRALRLASADPATRTRPRKALSDLAYVRWRAGGACRRAVGATRARLAIRTRVRRLTAARRTGPRSPGRRSPARRGSPGRAARGIGPAGR